MTEDTPTFALADTGMRIVSSFSFMCLLMYMGHQLREWVACTRRIMLPASLLGGLLGLFIIQMFRFNDRAFATLSHDWIIGWSSIPGFLINLIFATLFMGSRVPSVREAWRWAGPQVVYGQIQAFGNWMIACFFTTIFFVPAFGVNTLFGSVLPAGFEGGHGTAAGLASTFEILGFSEGPDLALTMATIGILLGVFLGTILCNVGNHLGWSHSSYSSSLSSKGNDIEKDDTHVQPEMETAEEDSVSKPNWRRKAVLPLQDRTPASYFSVDNEAIDTLALHVAFVGLALLLAYWTKRALMALETTNAWLTEYSFFTGFPLFPMCMLWGLAIQMMIDRLCTTSPLDRGTMERIGGMSLDFLVLTAIATTQVEAVSENIGPLLLLILFGLIWQAFCFFILAPILLPDYWFERALCEFGKGLGTTAVGLLLLRIVDPKFETPVFKAFSYKQMLTEPFVGGGIVTSIFVTLIKSIGNWGVCGICLGIILFWILVWFLLFRRPIKIKYKYQPEQQNL